MNKKSQGMGFEIDPLVALEKKYGQLVYSGRNIRYIHGKGTILYASDGQEYLDFDTGHGVANLGHSHPLIVKIIQEQANKLIVLHSSYANEERAKLFEKIAQICPSGLSNTFLSNSGSEAVEAAIKLAIVGHRNIKKPHFIAMKRSFHGRTLGALALTFGASYREAFQSTFGLDVTFASFGDIESVKAAITDNTVGIITEIVQGEGGVYPSPPDFPKALRELCNVRNLTLIFDEIQSGMGRTGKLFAFEHYNVIPDVLCLAKSLAAGIPIGATVAREELFKAFNRGEMGSTFGGNPFSCAIAKVTLDILSQGDLLVNAINMGNLITKTARGWIEEGLPLREHRGLGLMQGLQCKDKVASYLNYCFDHQLLILNAGMTVLRLLPPLIVSEKHVKQALGIIYTALTTVKPEKG